MSDILSQIAAYKREEVRERRALRAQADVEAAAGAASPPRGFRTALERTHAPGRLALIAEIKKASPSKGLIRADFDPPALARAYADGGAACLSVLTDAPSFQGADAYLVAARAACALPALRKEFLVDPWQVAKSRALGADAILVILAMVDNSLAAELMAEAARLGMDVLVETHDEAELDRAATLGAGLIGVNNRDLRTFVTDLAITERLAARAPENALLVTESGIFTPADATRLERCGAKAMLVGESLMRQADVAAATRALLGPKRRQLDFNEEHLENIGSVCDLFQGKGFFVMLTRKQHELLMFIHERIKETGVSPSFDEMKEALDLASKSGIHRLITALEERGFLRRLPHRARALEVVKLPQQATPAAPPQGRQAFRPQVVEGARAGAAPAPVAANDVRELSVLGRIAAGTPIDAMQHEREKLIVPEAMLGAGEHFVLEVQGDSMINAGIYDGDYVVIRRGQTANSGEIVVALVMGEEATLKRLRRKGASIALEAANPAYETRIFGPDQVQVQGKLVGLIRRYH